MIFTKLQNKNPQQNQQSASFIQMFKILFVWQDTIFILFLINQRAKIGMRQIYYCKNKQMATEFGYRLSDGSSNIFPSKQNHIRISPIKTRDSQTTRKSLKLFSSSIMQDRKKIYTRDESIKINSKIQLIRNKCMNVKPKMRSDSKKTLNSVWLPNQQLNQSVDLDSEDMTDAKKSAKVHLLRSIFQDRPPTVFFKYPPCCETEQRYLDRVYALQKIQLFYKISGSEYKCIVNSLEYNGFHKYQQSGQWNIYFDVSGTHLRALQNMNKYQKLNHFPGCWSLGRKDYMWKNLNKQRRSFPQAYNFVPNTYIFPADYDRFEMARETAQKNKLWIMKPTNQACGRGIKMVTKDSTVKNKKDILVSQYIFNPHLINNFKYDLRIYVLVTSYDPLRIYMFQEGLTRFATYEYNVKTRDVGKRFIHLTNFSVNKHSKKFVKNSKTQKDGEGSKWSLTALRKFYESIGINSQKLFDQVKDVIIKTCISAEPVMLDIHSKTQEKRTCGFELYGFDILIDSNLKPWLMEVNVCPSLSSSSPMDRKIKHTLLTDILNLIGIQYNNKKNVQILKKKEKQRIFNFGNQDKKYHSRNVNTLEQLNYYNCLDILSPEDWLVIFQSEQELSRIGNFERIFPQKSNIENYKKLFEINRYNNNILWRHIKSDTSFLNRLYQEVQR